MQQQTAPKPKKKIRVPRVINGIEQMVEIEVDEDSGPGWGPNDKHTLLNHPMQRVDGPLKVSGFARYTHDVRLPNMLYARIKRCPHAHAKIASIDTSAAEKIPGVAAVIQTPLTELRFAGAPVAAVAASSVARDVTTGRCDEQQLCRPFRLHVSVACQDGGG